MAVQGPPQDHLVYLRSAVEEPSALQALTAGLVSSEIPLSRSSAELDQLSVTCLDRRRGTSARCSSHHRSTATFELRNRIKNHWNQLRWRLDPPGKARTTQSAFLRQDTGVLSGHCASPHQT